MMNSKKIKQDKEARDKRTALAGNSVRQKSAPSLGTEQRRDRGMSSWRRFWADVNVLYLDGVMLRQVHIFIKIHQTKP